MKKWWNNLRKKIKAEINRFKKRYLNREPSGIPENNPTPQNPPDGSHLYAGFLGDNASIRYMDVLNPSISFFEFKRIVAKMKAHGFNMMLLALYNERDGSYAPAYDCLLDIRQANMKIRYAQLNEMHVQLWGRTDDSKKADGWSIGKIIIRYEDYAKYFKPDSWCVGLEYDEYGQKWSKSLEYKLVKLLKATGKQVAVHYTSYKKAQRAVASGADWFNAQTHGNASTSQMHAMMRYLLRYSSRIDIFANEFHRSSFSDHATKLANVAMSFPWCLGTGTGRPTKVHETKLKVKELDIPLDTFQDLKITKVTNNNIYFTCPDRKDYPRKDDGGAIDGRCYIYNSDGKGGFFDWIRPGQHSRDFKNVHNGYVRGFKLPGKGEPVFMMITDINKKKRTNLAKGIMS